MADPKYADLPGIAHDEPDVYETTDLPESEQTADFYEELENDPVEKIHMSTDNAFNKFKDKQLDAEHVDFSSRISRRLRTGYSASSGDWELVGPGQKETPLQKYQRLQCEMNELIDEVRNIKNFKEEEANCLVSTQKVEQALKELTDLRLEEALGEQIVAQISDPQGAQLKKLYTQLEQFKANIQEKPEAEANMEDSGIVYQFSYRPEQARLVQTTRLAELEGRLNRLENVIGASDDKLSRLASMTSKGSLFEVAQHLSATASLLDSSQLDHIEGRLAALAQKLESISEKKKEQQKDEEKDKMILELYEMVKNTENASKLLPTTIARLKALEELHNKATEFTKTLKQIEVAQAEMDGNLENNKTLLQGVQESFAGTLNEINSTFSSLDARIKALKQK